MICDCSVLVGEAGCLCACVSLRDGCVCAKRCRRHAESTGSQCAPHVCLSVCLTDCLAGWLSLSVCAGAPGSSTAQDVSFTAATSP